MGNLLLNLKAQWFKLPILAFIIFSFSVTIIAQNELVDNTLDKSRQLIDAKKFSEAADVLGSFEDQYPGNIYVERLYAQTLFWLHDFDLASTIYERAIGFHPNNMDVKYEYAIMLFDYKKYEYAKKLLIEYVSVNKYNGEAQLLLGKIYYYQRQFKEATIHLENAITLNPDDNMIKELYQQIYRIIAPQLSIGGRYRIDDQPMHAYGPSIKFNWYRSDILDLGISGNMLRYSDIPTSNLIASVQLSNSFNIASAGINLKMSVGGIYSKIGSDVDWIGGIHLVKKFNRPVQIDLMVERKNYDYTVSSVERDSILLVSRLALNISIGKKDNWNGLIGAQSNIFPDNNYVNSYYLWFLSRPVVVSNFKFYFGYSFNYMNSKEDRFEAVDSLSQIISNYTDKIEGIYNPYYTPMNQMSNSLLVNIKYQIGSSTEIYGHTSIGLFSKIKAPYLYLDKNDFDETVIVTGYSNQRYVPLDLGVSLQSQLSKKVDLTISYSYVSTYYFLTNNFNVGIKLYLK